MKQRTHREWFQPLARNGRCDCGMSRIDRQIRHEDERLFAWGEYITGKWHKVRNFCQDCFETEVKRSLYHHASGCGCTFELCARSGYSIPEWIHF
jgi:hypothetical protein